MWWMQDGWKGAIVREDDISDTTQGRLTIHHQNGRTCWLHPSPVTEPGFLPAIYQPVAPLLFLIFWISLPNYSALHPFRFIGRWELDLSRSFQFRCYSFGTAQWPAIFLLSDASPTVGGLFVYLFIHTGSFWFGVIYVGSIP